LALQAAQAHKIRVSIAPNPSHLEAVDPVVMGLVRALQQRLGPPGQQRVLGLLVHGDAAFAGLGIVPECLQLSSAPGETPGCPSRPALSTAHTPCFTCPECLHRACIQARLDVGHQS
jgi:hypothetical protein